MQPSTWPSAFLSSDSTATAEPVGCFHCALPTTGPSHCLGDVQGVSQPFCCTGCRAACEAIHAAGLGDFYRRVSQQDATLAPPPEAPADLAQYDLEEVQADFVQTGKDGLKQAELMIEGIHCASCMWLIERCLNHLPGVEHAEVNMVHHRLVVRWDPAQRRLTDLMQQLTAIGYAAVPFNPELAEGAIKRRNRTLLFRMAFAGFGVLNIMWISVALYAGAGSGIDPAHRSFFHWVSLAIATPVLLYSGGPFLSAAWRGLRRGYMSMDLPIAIGAVTTFAYSCWQTVHGGAVYFDTVVTFMFVILVGRYLEAMGKRSASSATLRLMELQPRTAWKLTGDGEICVSVRRLAVGDQLLIRPGDRVPADGQVVTGESHMDESMLTGESAPVHKQPGNAVSTGTINGEGPLTIEVTQVGANTRLSHIIQLVEQAQGTKARVQRLADRLVPWFVTATLVLAAITFAYWLRTDLDTALLAATSVLIITCPCALGLATPMAIAVSTGVAARRGILIRNGIALEGLAGVTHVVLDKTGTLTEGAMRVLDVTVCAEKVTPPHLLVLAGSVEHHFCHPLSTAITAEVTSQALPLQSASELQTLPGMGVGGMVDGQPVWIGNRRMMRHQEISIPAAVITRCNAIEASMGVAVLVAVSGRLWGVLHLQDRVREGAGRLIDGLRAKGLEVTLLTGDTEAAATHLSEQLGGIEVIAEVLPEDKAAQVERLQQQGARVLMIGDGVNDAPALAQADVSMAMGTGTDVSMACSDVVLMGGDLSRVAVAVALSQRTLRTIRQNLTLSVAYNMVLVPVAMAAWITPVFAAIAMPISSLLVIGNAIRIRTSREADAPLGDG